ncbi:nascent polypeptide-associated complex subunit alpha, muscle-specific form-like [Panicum miliaceum]|uniref:Nascent polypeptide-associated complex subunit alpha, muscle-specific form-like n=1 Tax=Panicum miliaceum TaxID=4540 RepID=A0A3L6RRB0_PANMI|nr:nascent polypeptide-associated complex subunit alpha, muscle-specific form-like [Panicum miliaceum]
MAAAAAPAAGAGKWKRKRSLSEDDVYLLLHRSVRPPSLRLILLLLGPSPRSPPPGGSLRPRVLFHRAARDPSSPRRYAPGTILTALQEVAQHAEGRRIDWRAVVGKSATGITSAREYQMLWRHFAYNHDLDETVDAGDQPLGDDSDLELELEPVPNPTNEALSEASALAKALISGSSREQASGQRVNLDAPVLNAPNEKTVRVPSEKQLAQNQRITNVTGPVSNSKLASHLGPSPGSLDPNGPSKKKKKPKAWSKEEDVELAAGVQKYGEGNWDYILHKCKFDNTRTPDQLSQRWALICKRPGGSAKPASTKHATVTSSEERKNTLKALSMAVGPMRRSSMLRPGAQQQGIQHNSTVFAPKIPEVRSAAAPSPAPALPIPVPVPVPVPMPLPVKVPVKSPLPQGQQAPVQRAPPKSANVSNKTRKKQSPQPSPIISPSSIQAAAIAAGGRIAPALTAANFLKVAQSAHIRSQVTGSSKPSVSTKAPSVVVEPGTQPGSTQHLEPLNTSTPKSGPSVLITHATEQVHGASEVAVVNPAGPSAGAHPLETNKALSTTPVPVSCDSEEKEDDSTFCVITIDDLFPEDAMQLETVDLEAKPEITDQKAKQLETVDPVDPKAKQPEAADPKAKQPETVDPKAKQPETADPKAKELDTLNPKVEMVDPKDKDMLEFDQYVASQGGAVNTDHLDKSKTGGSVSQAQGLVGSQKKQVKLVPTVGKGTPVSAGVPATVKRTKTSVPQLVNPVPAGSPRGIVGTVNANAPNKTLVRKATTLVPAGVQAPLLKKHATNAKGNQVMRPSTGSGVPASSQASVAINVVLVTNIKTVGLVHYMFVVLDGVIGPGGSVELVTTPRHHHAVPSA